MRRFVLAGPAPSPDAPGNLSRNGLSSDIPPVRIRAMSEQTTILVQRCLDRLRAGDVAARDELIECACDRLRRLTGQMLSRYPGVQRWEDTGDVCQNALLRLCRALRQVTPP